MNSDAEKFLNFDLISSSIMDEKALKIMEKMGYKSGNGLGKNEQGITKTPDITFQLGKKGFGMKLKTIDDTLQKWDFTKEEIAVQEKVNWIANHENSENFSMEQMLSWLVEGAPKYHIENETKFCSKTIVENVWKAKEIFNEMDLTDLNHARSRANPFETIRSVFFMNRAALKMANIDAATDFMFTNVDHCSNQDGHLGPYYFADVCAGPGGFTEYILWRKHWHFKGFGMTLKGENDFKLNESTCISPVSFQAFYGKDGDGNVCSPDNILDFKEKVLHQTNGSGVHFMMSDGGFSVEGNENLQEVLSKNIYICQCLVALEIVRSHGHFVTKLFDLFTPFSVGLLFLMFKCFKKVAVLKPNSSRPANSERYLICKNLKKGALHKKIKKYIWTIVKRLWILKDKKDVDILEIVSHDVIKSDEVFYSYILNSNNSLGLRQISGLQKLAAFCRNPTLTEVRQDELRRKCLDFWQIPDKSRSYSSPFTMEDLLNIAIDKPEILLVQPREIESIKNFKLIASDVEDWHYCTMYSSQKSKVCNFYAGVGSSKAYRLQRNKWIKVKNLQLCKGTLLYGEFVKENVDSKVSKSDAADQESYYKYTLQVIDALRLGDQSLANMRFEERLDLIKIYCKSVNREHQPNAIRIRPKIINHLIDVGKDSTIEKNSMDSGYISVLPVLGFKVSREFYNIQSLLLLKTNNSQSFHSTYVLRAQIYLGKAEEKNCLQFDEIIKEINHT